VSALRRGGCLELRPAGGRSGSALLALPPGGLLVRGAQRERLELSLGRFADDFPVATPGLPGDSSGALALPPDRAGVPWRARLGGIRAPVLACGL
jgi:hypothetical protein